MDEYLNQLELILQGYARYKKICNIFDYNDLMDVLRESLWDNTMFLTLVQHAYKYIRVDEYHDTNMVQKDIVEYLYETHWNILIVGDDAQSIYSFMVPNCENILRFTQ